MNELTGFNEDIARKMQNLCKVLNLRRSRSIKRAHIFKLDNMILKSDSTIPYLGLFDRTLSFLPHLSLKRTIITQITQNKICFFHRRRVKSYPKCGGILEKLLHTERQFGKANFRSHTNYDYFLQSMLSASCCSQEHTGSL